MSTAFLFTGVGVFRRVDKGVCECLNHRLILGLAWSA